MVGQRELLVLDGATHAVLEHQARTCAPVQVLIVVAILLTARLLGRIHRGIRSAQQTIQAGPALRVGSDTDTDPKRHLQPIDLLIDRHALDEFFGTTRRLFGVFE
ncbi:hypothetical protein D3C79_607390 [compost metagenome]